MIISKDSFLLQIPKAVSAKETLVLQGLSSAIQAVSWSFERLKEEACKIADSVGEEPDPTKRGLFVSVWSIVDNLHMIRSLLNLLPYKPGGEIDTFVKKYEVTTLLRNKMDHLPSNIENMINKKSTDSPIFGVVSFAIITKEDIAINLDGQNILKGCTIFSATAGAFTHPNHSWEIPNAAGQKIEFPVGLFLFTALDYKINISELILDLKELVEYFDTFVRKNIEDQIIKKAEKEGVDIKLALSTHMGGVVTQLRMSFNE